MTYSTSLRTFNEVLNKIMLQARMKEYRATLAELLTDAIREINLSIGNEGVKWKKLTPDDINTVSFPIDLEDVIGVGVPLKGKLWWLSPKNDIIRTTTEVLGLETQDESVGEGVDLPTTQFNAYFAKGGYNREGYYTIDYSNRRVMLNNVDKSEVILVYKISGITTDATPYIPAKYIPFLTAHVMFNASRYIPGMERRAIYLEDQYRKEYQRLQDSEIPALHEFYDALLSESSLLARR